jgi:two-component system, cell cycle response regulator
MGIEKMDESAASRALIAENEALRARTAYLTEQAQRNHEIMRKHQAFDLEIVSASNFPHLVGTIFRTLPGLSGLDVVTLTLLDPDADIYTVLDRLAVDFEEFPNLMFSESGDELGFDLSPGAPVPRPLLGAFEPRRHRAVFPHAPGLHSAALVPLLRNKRLIGCLNLGSRDPARFVPEMGTEFVEHMASIIAICLENVISNEMLKYIGLTDALTGAYNRRYIDRRLLEEVSRARRQDRPLAVMYIDIDHFKQVNDSVGHQGGDEVLREVATRIKAELRMSDALARFGGEEFVVLLADADRDSAGMAAERIRAGVARTTIELAGGQVVAVTVSIGAASFKGDDASQPIEAAAQQLLALADGALYQAKEGGRNRVVVSA